MTSLVTTLPPGTMETALAHLQQHAEHARGAYASNTERALRADIGIFTAWCTETGALHLPAAPSTVAQFIDAMGALEGLRLEDGHVAVARHPAAAAGAAAGAADAPTLAAQVRRGTGI